MRVYEHFHAHLCRHMFLTDYYFNLHHFSFQNIHSLFPPCYTYSSITFASSLPHILFSPLCPTPEPIFKAFTPADTVAPAIATGLKATHIITFTVCSQELSQQHHVEVLRSSLSLCVSVGGRIGDFTLKACGRQIGRQKTAIQDICVLKNSLECYLTSLLTFWRVFVYLCMCV